MTVSSLGIVPMGYHPWALLVILEFARRSFLTILSTLATILVFYGIVSAESFQPEERQMRSLHLLTACVTLTLAASTAAAAGQINGQYLESRSCDVYTGPCFANAEMGLTGKEAVMAWKVDEGKWNNISLNGLGAALIIKSEGTLGYDGVFDMKAGKIDSVLVVDDNATPRQREALIAFVKDSAKEYTQHIAKVEVAPIKLENDHLEGNGKFSAGKFAQIETRGLTDNDCVCTNEEIFYLPLTDVENYSPAYSLKHSYQGDSLNAKWSILGKRSAFLATFRR